MKLTARVSSILTGLLALGCFYGTFTGLFAPGTVTDPAHLQDARGFAMFWGFLGCVFLGLAIFSWKYAQSKPTGGDPE